MYFFPGEELAVRKLFDCFVCGDKLITSAKGADRERDKMNATLTTNNIATVVCEVVNVKTGETIEPTFESYGYARFQEFVEFYKSNQFADTIVWVRGYGYENGERVCLATEFIGLK